jgi:hypothetical protein
MAEIEEDINDNEKREKLRLSRSKSMEYLVRNNLTGVNNFELKKCSSTKDLITINSHKFVKKLVKSIDFDRSEEKKGNECGSLYRLLQSEYFDIHMLICYIDKKEETGIVDCLVNLMHEKFINESLFYIPQLCTMITYKHYYESLENYLLDRCVDHLKFSLKIHWLISSYIENNTEPKQLKKFDKLIQRIEMTIVNARRATMSSFKLYNTLYIKSEEEVYKHSLDKEYRLTYFDKVMRFYHDLKGMCEKLKDFPKENKLYPKQTRKAVLNSYLNSFNGNIKVLSGTKIPEVATNSTTIGLYKGYILPFDDAASTSDESNSLIVNFLPTHSTCFNSKARVPVKITVETIRVLECVYWDDLYIPPEENKTEEGEILNTEGPGSPKKTSNNNIIVEYSSIDDFFTKLDTRDKESINIDNNIPIYAMTEEYISKKSDSEKSLRLSRLRDTIKSQPLLTNPNEHEAILFDYSPDAVNPFGPKWSETCKKIKETSSFRNFETYSIKMFIAKSNDDLRQELLTMQLIKRFNDIFITAELPLKLRPYEIMITSPSSGLIECIPNTISIDGLKKSLPPKWNLNVFFRKFFNNNFEEAQKNFAESLAAYSLVSYIINIKDR